MAYWQSSLGFGGLQDILQSRRYSFETGNSPRRSSIRSPDIDSREMEDEILRQIREEGLLDRVDLENIDANQEDQISEKIAEAFGRRQSEKMADLAEQEQLQYDHGGPLTPSPANSPMNESYQHTPSSSQGGIGGSSAIRASAEALNRSQQTRDHRAVAKTLEAEEVALRDDPRRARQAHASRVVEVEREAAQEARELLEFRMRHLARSRL